MKKLPTRPSISVISSIIAILAAFTVSIIAMPRIVEMDLRSILAVVTAILGIIVATLGVYVYAKFGKKRKHVKLYFAYSQNDKEVAKSLISWLRDDGYNILLPEEIIKVGDNIAQVIASTIKDSDFVIVLYSRSSMKSENIKKEIDIAYRKKKKLFPVVLGDVKLPGILKNVQYVRIDKEPSEAIEYLEKSIRESIPEIVKK